MRELSLEYSDIDLKYWKEYKDIITDSLWILGPRDKTGGHKLDYFGNFIPQIATQMLLRYSKENEIVLDLFLGSGTTAIESVRLKRRCIGVEIQNNLVKYVKDKIPDEELNSRIWILQGDSTTFEIKQKIKDVLKKMKKKNIQFLILHPPYHDIIQFSRLPMDLCNAPTTDEFLKLFSKVVKNGYGLLEPGRFAALVIGDKYTKKKLIPLGFLCMEKMNEAGFITKSIIVKNIVGNERGKGKASNLWRYRALAGGFYVFKHEYIIVFQKKE